MAGRSVGIASKYKMGIDDAILYELTSYLLDV